MKLDFLGQDRTKWQFANFVKILIKYHYSKKEKKTPQFLDNNGIYLETILKLDDDELYYSI